MRVKFQILETAPRKTGVLRSRERFCRLMRCRSRIQKNRYDQPRQLSADPAFKIRDCAKTKIQETTIAKSRSGSAKAMPSLCKSPLSRYIRLQCRNGTALAAPLQLKT
jgi:hypothetical protein